MVVPVVMMLEGVHNGSAGPIYHDPTVFGADPQAWNGQPVTVSHPEGANGDYVSVNTPGMHNYVVGRIYNSVFSDGKLRAEAWIEADRLREVSPVAYDSIVSGSPLDVSIGAYSDEEKVEGEWKGESYIGIARGYVPDHLALLPGDEGACSWEDGCGVRANQSHVYEHTKVLDGRKVTTTITINAGFQELIRMGRNALDALDSPGRMHFLEEMFRSYMIYSVHATSGDNRTVELYKQSYTHNAEEDKVNLTGEASRVYRNVSYDSEPRPTGNQRVIREQETETGGTVSMSEHNCTCGRDSKISDLIAADIGFDESDKETLAGYSDEKLDKLLANAVKEKETETETEEEPKTETEEETQPTANKSFKPAETPGLTKQQRKVVERGVKMYNRRHKSLVTHLSANQAVYSEDELKKMELDELEKLYSLVASKTANSHSDSGDEEVSYLTLGAGGEIPAEHEVDDESEEAKDVLPWVHMKRKKEGGENATH